MTFPPICLSASLPFSSFDPFIHLSTLASTLIRLLVLRFTHFSSEVGAYRIEAHGEKVYGVRTNKVEEAHGVDFTGSPGIEVLKIETLEILGRLRRVKRRKHEVNEMNEMHKEVDQANGLR